MNSRPGKGKKADFQKGAKGRLPEREEACKPANDKPEELFDFNMLHELAHSIDDARGYMLANGPRTTTAAGSRSAATSSRSSRR